MTDTFALERYAETRDPEAFAHLVTRYQQMVYATCLRTLGNASDAEDAAQETFVKLAQAAGQVRSNVGAWLHRTATNVSINLIRSASRRRGREAEVAQPEVVADPEVWREWVAVREAVDEALAELPEDQRRLVVERYLMGRTQAELATEWGVSASMMIRRVRSAVEQLRENLRGKGHLPAIGVLVSGLGAEAAVAVPVGLGVAAGKVGLAGIASVAVPATGVSKIKLVAWVLGTALLLGGGMALVRWIPIPDRQADGPNRPVAASVVTPKPVSPTVLVPVAPSLPGRTFKPTVMTKGASEMSSNASGISMRSYEVSSLVAYAFEISRRQIDWIAAEPEGRYDVDLPKPDLLAVMRSELAHEFALDFSWQDREVEVWVVLKNGWARHRLAPTTLPPSAGWHVSSAKGQVTFQKCEIPALARRLDFELDAFVFDETGDDGAYDFVIPHRGGESAEQYAARISGLTGLRIERERRVLPYLRVEPQARRFALRSVAGRPHRLRPGSGPGGGLTVSDRSVFTNVRVEMLRRHLEAWMDASVVDETGAGGAVRLHPPNRRCERRSGGVYRSGVAGFRAGTG